MMPTAPIDENQLPKPILPAWIMNSNASETLENAGFASGSALALLHLALHDRIMAVPAELLRQRIALKAAVNCLKIEGRVEAETALRDALLLTHSGDARGPGGDMQAFWSKTCLISFRNKNWQDRLTALLPEHLKEQAPDWFDALSDGEVRDSPVAQAAKSLSLVLEDFPREEAVALLLADLVLSRALGWSFPVPLMAQHIKRKHLNADHGELLLACHLAVAESAQDATRLAHDLSRRAARFRAVVPKLRARGSDEAAQLFLSHDAVLPSSMLYPKIQGTNVPMTDRAARRFCDRLVELGVVREMTGRSTFRLYGI